MSPVSEKILKTVWFIILSIFITRLNGELLNLKNGAINGTIGKSKNGRLFQQFYAIPYAEPPIGSLRLQAPVAAKSWTGVIDGTKPPPKCIQPDMGSSTRQQEDCLYLNVFVPNDLFKASCKTPVIVYIHGGSYLFGTGGIYDPGYFMDKDVIVVTINYRLGVLGFFGLNNDIISGNFGLKDQVLALQWIKENIADFGGDPDKITLMGESAGASSVHFHMFSPLSKGLFHQAIMQSGSALYFRTAGGEGYGEAISTAFLVISGCFRNDSIKVLKCLQNLPAQDFITLGNNLHVRNNKKSSVGFRPIIESKVKKQPFLLAIPQKTNYQFIVPWLMGINSGEGAAIAASTITSFGNATNITKESIISILRPHFYLLDPEEIDKTVEKIYDFYFGSKDRGSNIIRAFSNITTDFSFLYPLVDTVKTGNDRQYVYYYDHRGSFSYQDFAKLPINLGAAHADELLLLFRNEKLKAKWTPGDELVSENLIKFWTNFAITGDPNGQSGEKTWKPTGPKGDIEYLHIRSNSATMEKNLLKENYEFWNSLFN